MAGGRSSRRTNPVSPKGAPKRRTPAEWGLRCALAVTVAFVGGVVIAQSLAQVTLANGDAATAYGLAPWDGRMSAALADKLTLSGDIGARAASLAGTALRHDPTTVTAVTTLATSALVAGQPKLSDRLFAYAERLSRRDLATQLWAIQNAVARENIPDALRHYDIALRTTAKAPDLLFPILSQAITDAKIRIALVATLAQQPPWAASFISYIATAGSEPQAAAQLFAALRSARVPIAPTARSQLVNTLVGRNSYDTAWAVYAAGHPRANHRRSRDPDFSADIATPAAFDWTPIGGPGVTTSIQRSGSGGLFDFATGPNVAGVLLQQLQLLPPGEYRLDGRSAGLDQPAASRPHWTLRCQVDSREFGRVVLANSAEQRGNFAGTFVVPSGCPAQLLALVAQPTSALAGVTGQIIRAALRSTGPAQ